MKNCSFAGSKANRNVELKPPQQKKQSAEVSVEEQFANELEEGEIEKKWAAEDPATFGGFPSSLSPGTVLELGEDGKDRVIKKPK